MSGRGRGAVNMETKEEREKKTKKKGKKGGKGSNLVHQVPTLKLAYTLNPTP